MHWLDIYLYMYLKVGETVAHEWNPWKHKENMRTLQRKILPTCTINPETCCVSQWTTIPTLAVNSHVQHSIHPERAKNLETVKSCWRHFYCNLDEIHECNFDLTIFFNPPVQEAICNFQLSSGRTWHYALSFSGQANDTQENKTRQKITKRDILSLAILFFGHCPQNGTLSIIFLFAQWRSSAR